MAIGELYSNGFISSIHKDDLVLTPWVATSSENQVIEFIDKGANNQKRTLNSLNVYANTTDLYIQILPSENVLYIEAGTFKTYNYESIKSFIVIGVIGQELRWEGMYY